MCGIVGYVGKRQALPILIEGLKRLEYRGYDSSGVAVLDEGKVTVVREVGKVAALDDKLGEKPVAGCVGIAHTRWATHGKPSERNAHPHSDCSGSIALVHNGIIENYRELRESLEKKGHMFRSETDSESIAHLIEEEMKSSDYQDAFFRALKSLKGTYAIVCVSSHAPGTVMAARSSSPLVLGIAKDEYVIASDASAIIEHTDRVIYLDDGEVAIVTSEGYSVRTLRNRGRDKESVTLSWTREEAQTQGFPHFMLKEIFEQPRAVEDAMRGRTDIPDGLARLGGLRDVERRMRSIRRIVIVSCGTSYYAGLLGKNMIEEYAGVPTEVDLASEFRYRKPILDERTLVVAISQSGETADTLAAVREARRKGALAIGIVNTVGSTIARETDAGVYNHAGPEIAVASTKAFVSQVTVLVLLTVLLGRQREMSLTMGKRILEELARIPRKIRKILDDAPLIEKIALKYADSSSAFFLGRKYQYPTALEGALKLKEISYVHAEGYAAGEMKHGPIALLCEGFPVVALAPKDSVFDKIESAMEEAKARGARLLAITTQGNASLGKLADDVILIPKTLEMLTPLLSVVPLQLLAYYVAVARGLDVDKPRNLAKSVTVE